MNHNILAIIPARGGSKGIPQKNLCTLGAHSLVGRAILEAKKSTRINKLILSSDDMGIIEEAKKYDCEVPFIRPKFLAEDHSSGIDPVIHALHEFMDYDVIVLLQPTSPFRQVEDIDKCIEMFFENEGKSSVVSVNELDKKPDWMFYMNSEQSLIPILENAKINKNRQAYKKSYILNGAVYVSSRELLLKERSFMTPDTRAYIMPKWRSIDIDTPQDLWLAQKIEEEFSFFNQSKYI